MIASNHAWLAAAVLAFSAVASPGLTQDRDYNPPGRIGGAGTNWENRPGLHGGPGASPDRHHRHLGRDYALAPRAGGYLFHADLGYLHPTHGWWNQAGRCWVDRDGNPPGRVGGAGTNWENPPGLRGGPGLSPDRFGRCR